MKTWFTTEAKIPLYKSLHGWNYASNKNQNQNQNKSGMYA